MKTATQDQAHHRVVKFGKHKGKRWHELPDGYLKWVLDNFEEGFLLTMAKNEVGRRMVESPFTVDRSKQEPNGEQLPSKRPCNRKDCCGTMKRRKTSPKRRKKQQKQAYYYTWYWLCDSCKRMQMDERAKVFNESGQPSTRQKHSESDWDSTHYRCTGPTGVVEHIPNDVSIDGRENETAPS